MKDLPVVNLGLLGRERKITAKENHGQQQKGMIGCAVTEKESLPSPAQTTLAKGVRSIPSCLHNNP